jgi:hypothetical protein
MAGMTLIDRRLTGATWQARIVGHTGRGTPRIEVLHQGRQVPEVTVMAAEDAPGEWDVVVPLPAIGLSEGIQLLLVNDESGETRLAELALIGGELPPEDLRAEVALLRAELDMLKRAFRRHCIETA